MVLDLMEDLGGWNSWRRTFLSVLGVPFPPTTWKVVKIILSVQNINLCWKYWFSLLVYCSAQLWSLLLNQDDMSQFPSPALSRITQWELSLPVMRFGAKKSKEDLHGEVTPCKWMDCSVSHKYLLLVLALLAFGGFISRYFLVCFPPSTKKQNLQNAKFDLDRRSASKPAEADVASYPNNMFIFTYL